MTPPLTTLLRLVIGAVGLTVWAVGTYYYYRLLCRGVGALARAVLAVLLAGSGEVAGSWEVGRGVESGEVGRGVESGEVAGSWEVGRGVESWEVGRGVESGEVDSDEQESGLLLSTRHYPLATTPPQALRLATQPVIDARDFGVVANDGRGDGAALARAVDAAKAAGGGVVQLPSGVLNVWHTKLDNLRGITLRGHGATGPQATTLRRQRSTRRPDRERILTLRDAEDFTMHDLAIDMNRQQWYGGIGVYRCTRCTFERLRLYDAKPYPYAPSPDRYAIVFGYGGRDAPHEDLVIRHNRIEDLQLEVDHARRVEIVENVLIRGDFTAAVGSFALGSGYLFEDVVIARNRIVNAARQAITLQLDFRPHETVRDVVFRRITVQDNVLIYHATVRQAPALAVRLGMHDNSVRTPGTVFADITVTGNQVYLAPGVPHRAAPLVVGNVSGRSGWRWRGLTVRGNTLYAAQPRRLVAIRRVAGDVVQSEGNTTHPYRPPPQAPWPAERVP